MRIELTQEYQQTWDLDKLNGIGFVNDYTVSVWVPAGYTLFAYRDMHFTCDGC